jgi:sorbitol-specific phosphotransferase system component IIA
MKHTRLASPTLTLVTAIATTLATASLTAVPAASASPPEFNPGTSNPSIGEGSTVALETSSTQAITCTKITSTGEITGAKTVGSVVIVFHGCSSKEGEGCSLKSTGQGAGLIRTETLDGELGSVKKAEAASGVGLLILPTSGTKFVELEGPCLLTSPSPITGQVAAEVTPIRSLSKDGKLILLGSGGTQDIRSINILGTIVAPRLKALGLIESSASGVGLALLTNAVEVT